MRYLWLIRHAKSAEGAVGQRDHERPLNARGEQDGPNMARWYARQCHKVQWIWASTATRAQATAEFVAQGMQCEVTSEGRLYLASAETILDIIRITPPEVEGVAVVAHNPGLTHAANMLSQDAVTDNLVTFASALFAVENDWADVTFGTNHFLSLTSPKGLTDPLGSR